MTAQDEPLPFPPMESILSAYEAGLSSDCRRIMSVTLVSSEQKIRKWILEFNVVYLNRKGETVEEHVIGKIYADREKGIASYRLMQHLWDHGMGADSNYRIIRPIAFLENWGLLLMSKAPGKTLDDYILDAADSEQAAHLAAGWLLRMHAIPIAGVRDTGRKRAEADIGRFTRELEQQVPGEQQRIKAINELLTRQSVKPWTGQPVLLHGDFHTRNVFIDGQGAVAIDLDHYFVGDPAWDVAYLTCQIQISAFFKLGDFHQLDPMIREFVSIYLNAHPDYDRRDFLERISLYRARSLFESLHYHLCVLNLNCFDIVDLFLELCSRSLQGKGFVC